MKIPFHKRRSDFIAPIQRAIAVSPPVGPGDSVQVNLLDADGYTGSIVVEVSANDANTFESDWKYDTHFPARIKAAATALRDARQFGRYQISHAKGNIRIVRLED